MSAQFERRVTPQRLNELYAEYGFPGDAIAGSKYFRGYCKFCAEPMRSVCMSDARVGACACQSCIDAGDRRLGEAPPASLHCGNPYEVGDGSDKGDMP